MRVLYYTWDEFNAQDGIDSFREMGCDVTAIRYEWQNLGHDDTFERALLEELRKKENGAPYYDFVFSYNFFPVVSIACKKTDTPYLCLVFDSPFLPLTSVEIDNPRNHIYTFDRKQAQMMRAQGHETMHYSPLGVKGDRVRRMTEGLENKPYAYDICFLGTLYDDEYDFYDQITYLPPDLKGYFDGVIAAQEHVFGYDMIGEESVVSAAQIARMHEYVNIQRTEYFTMDENIVLRDLLRKKVTKNERPKLLAMLAKYFQVDLYTRKDQKIPEGVRAHGFADYYREMPRIFHRAKINLNLTLRTIISGIPLRVLDVMAAGGFLITTFQEEVAARFADGEELVIATTPEDLLEKCAYYLTHDGERERIAAAGRKKVLEHYDYKQILKNMLDQILVDRQ